MAKTIYFLLPSAGANYTDFQLDYGALTTVGEDIQFTGSSGVDAVYARPGMIFDFTLSGSSADKLYLSGSYASYTTTVSGNVITLTRGSGQTLETVTVSYTSNSLTSDVIVYSDGKLSTNTLANFIKNGGTAPVLSTAETSVAPIAPAAAGSSLDANILAYGLNATGDTFASMKPGMKFQAIGGAGVDKVYVSDGGNVDASLLGSSQDLIYLRGAWADYSKAIAGNTLTLARDINGFHEQVVTSFTSSGLTSDKLIFQDGSVTTYAAKTAVLANASVAITSVSGFDAATVTPGVNPSLQASPLSNVTNLDVTSNIVLNYGQNIKGVSGKFIHIVNDGGTGFHGENTTNTLDISVTDLSQVTVVNGVVTINPLRELDLANNYHIMVDAGAFTSTATGAATLAFDGTNLLKFSTVTPGTSASGDMTQAALSQTMDASGNLVNSYKWFDIEKLGTPAASLALDLSTGKYALVAKDYNAAGATYLPDPSQGNQLVAVDDGIQVGDFNVAPSGFGADDWVYIDNQNNALNDLTATSVVSKGTAPTVVLFTGIIDAANSNSGLGGQIKLTLAGTPNGFVSIPAMQTYLQTSLPPVYTDPGSVTVAPATQTVTGTVSDGYISGAAVYLDINKNGKYDAGTDVQVGTTDATGKFTGTINQANASSSLLVVGGTDTSTGLAFTGVLKAPTNYAVVNPLTTLVSYLNEAGVTGAEAKVLSALGLTSTLSAAGASLSSFDPLAVVNANGANAVAAAKVQAAALQVANVIVAGSAAVVGASSDAGNAAKIGSAANAVMTAFADTIKTGATFDLTDGTAMTTLLSSSALKTAAASAGLSLNATSLTDKAASAGLALDAINTAIGNSVASTSSATAAADLANAIKAQYVAQNVSGNASTSLMSSLLSSGSSATFVADLDTPAEIVAKAQTAPTPQLDPTGPSTQVTGLVAALVSGSNYNLTGTLSKALVTGETLRASFDGGATWESYSATTITGTSFTLSGKTLGAAGQILMRVVDGSGKSGLGFAKDVIPPLVTTVTDDTSGTANTATTNVAYTYTFNEAVTGLAANDFTVTNGAVASVSGSGTTWTVNVTPAANVASGNIGVTLNAGAVVDAAGNPNLSSSQSSQAIDTVAPTAVIQNVVFNAAAQTVSGSLSTALAAGESVLLSKDNGVSWVTASATAGSTTWSLSGVTLTGGLTMKAKVVDAAGNQGQVATQSYVADTTAPGVPTLAEQGTSNLTDAWMNNAESTTTTLRVTLVGTGAAAPVTGDSVELLLGGASFGSPKKVVLTDQDITNKYVDFTVVRTDLGADGTKALSAKVVDVAGNASTASTALNFTLDTVAPTAVIQNVVFNAAAQTVSGSLSLALAAGESVLLSKDNGVNWVTASATAGSTMWSLSGVTLTGGLTMKAKVVDAAGNQGQVATQSYAADTTAPGVPTLVEYGSTDLADGMMSNVESASTTFRVGLTGSGSALPVLGDSVELLLGGASFTTPKKVILSSNDLVNNYVDFTLQKTDLGVDGVKSLSAKVTDVAGNASAPSTALNFTLDTTPPMLQNMQLTGNSLKLTFSETLDASHLPSPTTFAVQLDGVTTTVNSVTVSSNQMTLALASSVMNNNLSLSYTDPTVGDDLTAIQDLLGNDASGFSSGMGVSAPASPLDLKWASTTGTTTTTSNFEVWLKPGYSVGSADLSIALDPTKATLAVVDGSTPSGTSSFLIANSATNPASLAFISLPAVGSTTSAVKLFSFNATTLAASGNVYELYMQSASLGFDDPTQNTGGQTPAVQHFIVGGTGSDQLNLMLGSTAAGPTPTTLIGGTAADTGTDVAKVDLSSIIANVSGALTVSVESAALWHIRDSSATPKTLVDVRVNTVTSGTSYDLVFHKPNSTDTVTDTLINVESLKFYNGNTFLSGWNLADHSTLVV